MLKMILVLATVLTSVTTLADDIDLFVGRSTQDGEAPNLLIVLDNTGNWGPVEKFNKQKAALVDAFDNLPNNSINVGLMLYTETGGGNSTTDGGYVRAAIRPLNANTKAAYRKLLVGDPAGTGGLDVVIDRSNSGKSGLAMAEAYLYFDGGTPYAGNIKNKTDYLGNKYLNDLDPNAATCCADSHDAWSLSGNALNSRGGTSYNSPIDPNSCADNYILYIGNGPAQDSSADSSAALALLEKQAGVSEYILGEARSGGLPVTPSGSRDNMADEWAYFANIDSPHEIKTFAINLIDVNRPRQCTNTANAGWSALMRNMSEGVGGGDYYQQCGTTFDENKFAADLSNVLGKILSRNSVFASVALPAAANEQSTFLNQVYVGLFRPHPRALPRWDGNLKQYKIAIADNQLRVVDAAEQAIVDTTDTDGGGFIQGCARSFWTPTSESPDGSGNYYWDFLAADGDDDTNTEENCLGDPAGSNTPDGYVVEKGGHGYALRAITPAARALRMWTCNPTLTTCNSSGLELFRSANAAITPAALDANDPVTDRDSLIAWAIGADVDDEDADGIRNEIRPSAHGDIVHGQPVALDYAGDPNNPETLVFYGGNDGVLRAINGNQTSSHGGVAAGYEFWSFIPPEFYGAIKRLRVNENSIRFPASGPTAGNGVPGDLKDYGMDGPMSAYQSDNDGDGAIDERTLLVGMRRLSRQLMSFDITSKTTPTLNWKVGCPDLNDPNDPDCTSGFKGIGQTWSKMSLFYASGYDPDIDGEPDPLIMVGGGYDACEDYEDGVSVNHACSTTTGNKVYVLDAETGAVVRAFPTDRSVPGNVTIVPYSDDNPNIVLAYAVDTGGNVYRISGTTGSPDYDPALIDNTSPATWVINKIASLGCDTSSPCSANRKFLFAPDVVRIPGSDKLAILVGSGDREKPLLDYSVSYGMQNYFYSLIDQPANPDWFDDAATDCGSLNLACNDNDVITTVATGDDFDPSTVISKYGWKLPLRSGEQAVTGAITVDNEVNFSTHIPVQPKSCDAEYGEVSAYTINYRDGSGSTVNFIGGGLVPTPVAGKVLIDGVAVPFCIGCGSEGSPIGAGKVGGGITWTQPRSRVWWNIDQVDD
jgi:type IV pilus assembly protein PilY1